MPHRDDLDGFFAAQPGAHALPDSSVAARAAEDEGDGGQQALAVEPVDDRDPRRGPETGVAPPGTAAGSGGPSR